MCWELQDNYVGFATIPCFALSKYEYVIFTNDDYVSWHRILFDDYYDLRELEMVDLISNADIHDSGVIDAVFWRNQC